MIALTYVSAKFPVVRHVAVRRLALGRRRRGTSPGHGRAGAGARSGPCGRRYSWFDENARDLPWRRTRDPWRILVSEMMLQQIQVKRAIPFYERFLTRSPTVRSLAGALLSDAIRVWGDLGRYRRVVSLHRTARIVVEDHGGLIPADPEVLVGLPGIGPYTAGAVACFAYERDVSFGMADTTSPSPSLSVSGSPGGSKR